MTLTAAQQSAIDSLAKLYRCDGHEPRFVVRNLREEIAEYGELDPARVPDDAIIVFRDWEDDSFDGEHMVPDEGVMLDAAGLAIQDRDLSDVHADEPA